MTMVWNGAGAKREVELSGAQRVQIVARILRRVIVKGLSRQASGGGKAPAQRSSKKGGGLFGGLKSLMKRRRSAKGSRGRGRRGYVGPSSAPFDWPNKQTGHLSRNINMEYDPSAVRARVGTNVEYGKHLELGTRKMARRPFMSLGIKEAMPAMRQFLSLDG